MLVRCERCRAVYQLTVATSAPVPVVQCVRCQLLFKAHVPSSLGTVGTLGGAAAQAVAAVPRLREIKPPRNWSVLVAVLVGVAAISAGVAGVLVWRAHVQRSKPEYEPGLASARADAGELLLWRDDLTSLEAAVATFSEAQSLEPQRAGFAAQKALATLLLGLAMRAEDEDLTAELKQLEEPASDEKRPVDARPGGADSRAEELRRQLPGVSSRAESFIREGLALLNHARLMPDAANSPQFERAELLAAALMGQRAVTLAAFESWSSNATEAPSVEAWRAYTAGIVRVTHRPTPLDWEAARVEFDLAARLSPHFIQAKWQLARACLAATPADRTRARAALEAILQLNPHHEGATRALQLLAQPTGTP